VERGSVAGCQAVFVDYGYRERRPDAHLLACRSLREAASWIVQKAQKTQAESCAMTDRVFHIQSEDIRRRRRPESILELAENP